MLDLLDILQGRAAKTNPATYYERLPEAVIYTESSADLYALENGGKPIDHETLDPMSYQLRALFGDVTDGSGKVTAIKTNDRLEYKVGGYIATADGTLYVIDAVTVDTTKVSKQAMRFSPIPFGTEYVLRLIEVENERGIR